MELAVPASLLTWRPGPFHRALAALPVNFPSPVTPVRTDEAPDDARAFSPAPAPAETGAPQDGSRQTGWSGASPHGLAAILSTAREQRPEPNTALQRWWNSATKFLRGL